MPDFDPLADLMQAAYAPFRDPRDYILSWTDQIWIDKGLGRLGEHYADDIKVHTAYGETYDFEHVILNSVQKMSAFPNGGGGSGGETSPCHGRPMRWGETCTHPPVNGLKRRCGRAGSRVMRRSLSPPRAARPTPRTPCAGRTAPARPAQSG